MINHHDHHQQQPTICRWKCVSRVRVRSSSVINFATLNVANVPPAKQDIATQATPSQIEHENLRIPINGLHHHFLKLLHSKQTLNGETTMHPNYKDGGNYQRNIMTLIENYFKDSERTIEINLGIV